MQVDVKDIIKPFDFEPRTRMVFGAGSIERLGELAIPFGNRVLVISDPGVVAAGHTQKGISSLEKAGAKVLLFDGAQENPTTANVESGLAVAKEFRPELIIGLGGGSSMDCAKGINFLYSCGGKIQDYWGVGKATSDLLPMVAIPTTSGTGSEMQSFALISDAESHVKMACGDKRASCKIAILDPELTLTQPSQVTALTGIDAISHALETFVTTKRNSMSSFFSKESWRLLASNFHQVLTDPNDLDARASMQLGAAFAGLAIENSMLGASHALANPLTAEYDTSHGQAVGLMLPHVIRFNAVEFEELYEELYDSCNPSNFADSKGDKKSDLLADAVQQFVRAAGLATQLNELGVEREKLGQLAGEAAKQWTGNFNPRPVDAESLLGIYEQAF